MEHFDILAGLIIPPTSALVDAIETGLVAIDADHVSPEAATALMQHLCAKAQWVNSSEASEAGIAIFKRLMALGGDPWKQVLVELPNAATSAMTNLWEGPVELSVASCPVPIDGLRAPEHKASPAPWLHLSVKHQLHAAAGALLKSGADPNYQTPTHPPALHEARDLAMVRLLLGAGAKADTEDQDGCLCVDNWDIETCVDYIHMLGQVMGKGEGLDRVSLLKISGRGPRASKPLTQDLKNPRKDIVDDQGRSIFFQMAARTLNSRGQDKGNSLNQVLALMRETLGWMDPGSTDPLDRSAARLLLWTARVVSRQSVHEKARKDIEQLERHCGLAQMDRLNTQEILESALTCLDTMVEAEALDDPSEIAATALGGLWGAGAGGDFEATDQTKNAFMARLMDPESGCAALQWLDRCNRGVEGGLWHQGKSSQARWASPDIPVQGFCRFFLDFATISGCDHPMWSNPDTARALVQILRGNWPKTASNGYYTLNLPALDEEGTVRLERRYAPLFDKMEPSALREAARDRVCSATLAAIEAADGPLRSLRARVAHEAMIETTNQAGGNAKAKLRF